MQMTYEQAMRPGALMLFAARRGSGYMMRSEKRGGAYGSPNRRPPKRKKAGFFYIFCTLLLSVLLWPIGMVMLWQRKVRMTAGTKLLISLLTLCLSVFLIVFALTVPLDNVEYTAFQDKANDWLDKAAADVAVAGDAAIKKTTETWQAMTDFSEASATYSGAYTADFIDAGVKAASQARSAIEGLFNHRDAPTPAPIELPAGSEAPADTDEPEASEAPQVTEAPADTDVPEVEVTEAAETPEAGQPAETPGPSQGSEVSEAPEATDVGADVIRLPDATPVAEDAQPLGEGTLHANGEFEAGSVEAATDAPAEANTAAPLSEAAAVPLKPATALPTEAVTRAPEAETTDEPAEVTTEEPVEAATEEPVETATEEPVETATEEPVEAATEEPVEAATEEPVEAATEEPVEAATEEPIEATPEEPVEAATEEPTETATEEPVVWEPVEEATEAPVDAPAEAIVESPTEAPVEAPVEATEEATGVDYTVKPAGQATVYFFTNGSVGFHNGPNRHDMKGAPAHTLQEAFDMDKHPCKSCGMPDRSILEVPHIAWIDGKNLIHTTDECERFSGQWRLMSLDKALAAGYEPCEACGADFYAEEIFPAPTPSPTPQVIAPSTALKSAGEVTVYYYNSSKGYHIAPDCTGMQNAPAHTLAEAVSSGKNACHYCKPPAASLLGLPMMWLDESGIVHTSDECAAFVGNYRLVSRNDALTQGLSACPDCGAAEYLVPGTVLAGE